MLIAFTLLLSQVAYGIAEQEPDPTTPHTHTPQQKKTGIIFEGNLIFEDQFYLTLLDSIFQHTDWELTATSALHIAQRIQKFLHDAGYELAHVQGRLQDNALRLTIDEGKLGRIIFRGHNAFNTVRLRLELNIPENIYNRPALNRQLQYIRTHYNVEHVSMRLVPTENRNHIGWQIENFGPLQGYVHRPSVGRYDLLVTLGRSDWRSGFNIHLKVGGPDGVLLGTSYTGTKLLFDNDRWRLRLDGGVRSFAGLNGRAGVMAPTRGLVTIEYGPAPIGNTKLRPFLHLYSDLWSRQRVDLGIERYYHYRQGAELRLDYELTERMRVGIGLGAQNRNLFFVDRPDSTTVDPSLAKFTDIRSVIALRAHFVFDHDQHRLDRQHQATFDLESFTDSDQNTTTLLRIDYRKVFELGWHDLWLRLRGLAMGGKVRFVDEIPMTYFLRGVFGDEISVRQGAGASLGARFSLARDLYKVGVFADTAVYQRPNEKKKFSPVFAAAFGPSLHTLVMATLQVNVYYVFGFQGKNFDTGLYLGIRKAY